MSRKPDTRKSPARKGEARTGDLGRALSRSVALVASRAADDRFAADRFAKADAYLEETAAPPIAPNAPAAADGPPAVPARAKVVRDTFSFPQDDYQLIKAIQDRLIGAGVVATKSEVLRLGLRTLEQLETRALTDGFGQIKKLKPGRPRQQS